MACGATKLAFGSKERIIKIKTAPVSLSAVINSTAVLPGESEDDYQAALQQTVQELSATTPLQIYLAQKIFDCLWWMRRYENQKRAGLIQEMVKLLSEGAIAFQAKGAKSKLLVALAANQRTPLLKKVLAEKEFTIESLTQAAYAEGLSDQRTLDELIALKTRTLAGFQVSYEVLVNRKINRERLELQNALLRGNLNALENASQPKTKSDQ
jgi:hypothetical protein